MRRYLLPPNGQFYKANLHCHSTVSTGKLTPEQIKKAYMDKGYSIVAYTDHDIMIDHSYLAEDTFLPLRGYEMEISEDLPEGAPSNIKKQCHMCLIALDPDNKTQVCWHREKYLFSNALNYKDQAIFDENEPDYERYYSPECISDMMQRGRDAGFFVTYNHPAWSMETAYQYMNYHGMHAMEICNFDSFEAGYEEYSPKIYDEMLRGGERIYCIGTDDNHNATVKTGKPWDHDSFGAFTVIKADKLEYRTITKAMENGNFYASQGPEIYDLYLEDDNTIHVTCSAARRIQLATGIRYNKSIWSKNDDRLTEATFEIPLSCNYFRLTVVDAEGRAANTRAYFLDELK